MTAMPFSFPIFKAFTTTGTLGPLAGGLLHTFEAGTSTPLAVYQDAALTTPHTNPVVLDSNGQATIYLGPNAYKMRLEDSTGAVQPGWPIDYIEDALDNAKDYTDTLRADLAASSGSSLVGFLQSGTGAVARTVRDKERDKKDPRDYGLWDGTTTDLAAILACISATAEGGTVEIPDGDINLGTGLVIPKALTLRLGSGEYTGTANPLISWTVRGVHVEGKGAHQLSLSTKLNTFAGAGYCISATGNTGYDFSSIRNLSIVGNVDADGGVYLQGEAKCFTQCEGVWVESFTKATGKAWHLSGMVACIFTNCHASDSHYGFYLDKSGAVTSNLNQFYGCNTVANVMSIYIGGGSHANEFHRCNIAGATSSPSVLVEHGAGNTFYGCYFEANAAGTCTMQVGVPGGATPAHRTICDGCYITESKTITSFMHVYSGYGCGLFRSKKESGGLITNLVYYDATYAQFGVCGFNGGNYPATDVAGNVTAVNMALNIGGQAQGDIYKNLTGIGRLEFGMPFSPKQCTVAQLGTGGIAPNTVGTTVYVTNGRKPGEGAGSGTGVLAVYTNGAYRDIGSGTYAVVAS